MTLFTTYKGKCDLCKKSISGPRELDFTTQRSNLTRSIKPLLIIALDRVYVVRNSTERVDLFICKGCFSESILPELDRIDEQSRALATLLFQTARGIV